MSRARGTELDLSGLGQKEFGKIDLGTLGGPIKNGSADDLARILKQIEVLREAERFEGFHRWFVPGSPYSIENLPKHAAFFKATRDYREVYFSASNQTGKTSAGVYATVLHLTGEYPDWWEGKRYDKPVVGWALGDTTVTVRNILQTEFLGKQGDGTGMIPASYIVGTTAKSGSSGAKEKIYVRHKSGGISELSLYSYEQGRKFFQGVKLDFVFMDELPPASLYGEAIMRTISTNGIVYVTATPLDGLTPVVLNFYIKADFLPEGSELPGVVKLAREDQANSKGKNKDPSEVVADDGRSKAVIVASWDDAPWLTEQAKKEILDSVPENERESRSKGLPTMGSGTVYPLAIEDIVVGDFPIPDHWKRVAGLDVGWNFTAGGWIAQDPDSGKCYLYSEYKRSKAEPIVHAEAIKQRGDWINVAVDPAALGRGQADGKQIYKMYKDMGIRVHIADNGVEAGIYKVWEMLSTGQLKIFKSCIETQREYITYRRDDKGRIVKENDHLMDGALRYPCMALHLARQKPVKKNPNNKGSTFSGMKYDI